MVTTTGQGHTTGWAEQWVDGYSMQFNQFIREIYN